MQRSRKIQPELGQNSINQNGPRSEGGTRISKQGYCNSCEYFLCSALEETLNILSQHMENIKKTQTAFVQMKTTLSEKKNTPDGVDDRADTADKMREHGDAAVETP